MYYWNKDNFKNLKLIEAELRTCKQCELLADYCNLRELGLRSKALEKLDEFINLANKFTLDKKIKLVQLIMKIYINTEVHNFITFPLQNKFIEPTLIEWLTYSEDVNALNFMGVLTSKIEYFKKAFALDNSNQFSAYQLSSSHIDDVDYITHHLNENILLGKIEEGLKSIAKAEYYLSFLKKSTQSDYLASEIKYYKNLILDWQEYTTTTQGISFPKWCYEYKKNYSFSQAYYYDEN